MKFWKVLGLILSATLSACGSLGANGIFGSNEATDSAASLVSYALVEPEVAGGEWQRQIQVHFEGEREFWTIEKRVDPAQDWRSAGFTDAQGIFIDHEISGPAEYRVALVYTSPRFEGVRDVVLQGAVCEGSEARRVVARRVVVPAGATAVAASCDLEIEATEIRVEGELRSFAAGSLGGRDAPQLRMRADRIAGAGKIEWNGENGRDGGHGADGAGGARASSYSEDFSGGDGQNGANGEAGQAGGKGGTVAFVLLAGQRLDVWVKSEGGKGGQGGAGGRGGGGGKGTCGFSSLSDSRGCGSDGRRGRDGVGAGAGADGANGTVTVL